MSAFEGMTDEQLMDLAKRIMVAWVAEPLGSIERAMKAAAHEAVMNELKRRVALQLNAALGLPPVNL